MPDDMEHTECKHISVMGLLRRHKWLASHNPQIISFGPCKIVGADRKVYSCTFNNKSQQKLHLLLVETQ